MNGQLELNLGLLNEEQQKKVDRFLDDRKRSVTHQLAYAQRKVEALEAAGFELGKDFESTVEVTDVVDHECEFQLDWRNDDLNFTHSVSYQDVRGDVFIKATRCEVEDDCIVYKAQSIWFTLTTENKIECSQLVGSYRAVKPETLLRKLDEYNTQQVYYAEAKLKRIKQDDAALKQLQELYPHATVLKKEHVYESTSNYGRSGVKRIVVEFKDGSSANFAVDYNGKLECTHVWDVERDNLSNWDKVTIVSQRNK